jgi:hydroxylaminobenzene mutase
MALSKVAKEQGLHGSRRPLSRAPHQEGHCSSIRLLVLNYSDIATVASFLMAAVWGAGNSVMPLAAGTARGSDFQDIAIMIAAYSGAPTGIVSFALVLRGLRVAPVHAE